MQKGTLFLCWTSPNGHRKLPAHLLTKKEIKGTVMDSPPPMHLLQTDSTALETTPQQHLHHYKVPHCGSVSLVVSLVLRRFSQQKCATSATERHRKNLSSPKASSLNGLRHADSISLLNSALLFPSPRGSSRL